MKRKILIALFSLCILMTGGCTGSFTGKFEEIAVTSNPSGIKVLASTGDSCYTPGILDLRRNKDHVLYATYLGQTQEKTVHHGLDPLFLGRSLFGGGVVNSTFNVATGSCDGLNPDEVHFDFTEDEDVPEPKKSAEPAKSTIDEINEIAERIRNIK
ncbi:MAG: hypothetical protein JSV82_03280 [Planctomycetota bacterium]|nr:MAG: hypothetical protein JSV82_03280 [Planctomycetota bacterium]